MTTDLAAEPADEPRGGLRAFVTAVLLAVAFFAAIAPTLSLQPFASGSENLNVQTVLEMRRGGPWLVPTLRGYPRTIKPPLTAWTNAAFVSPDTVAALGNPDATTREAAYRQLAWEIRWPTLALSCITIALIFEMGRLLGGYRVGLAAGVVAGTTILFARFGRMATTDVQLALWVTATNVLLLHAVLRGRWWGGCLGAGAALGLAFMSKGPVALVQTLVPFVAVAGWMAWRRPPTDLPDPRRRPRWGAIAAGLALMLVIALPWWVWVLYNTPDIVEAWVRETTRKGATNLEPDPWYNYLSSLPWMFPWLVFFVIGLIMTAQAAWRGDRRQAMALGLLLAPIVVMSFFQDKPTRYLQPLLAPAAVITAIALGGQWRAWCDRPHVDRVLAVIHWVGLAVAIVGLALAGSFGWIESVDGAPWFPARLALPLAVVGLALLAVFIWLSLRRPLALLVGTAALMLAILPAFVVGYARSRNGTPETKAITDHLWATAPHAEVVVYIPSFRRSPPMDLLIYSNRVLPVVDSLDGSAEARRADRAIFLRSGDESDAVVPDGWQLERQWQWGDRRTWSLFRRTR